MNDGVFQEGQLTHPLGRCIFVFAGGTSSDFQHFGPAEDASEEKRKEWRLLKGPDFKSRLHGTLDILGPNPRQIIHPDQSVSDDPLDVGFPLRRAILLRSVLKLKPDARLEIDPGLLSALLETPRYTNGSRSFEKICLALLDNSGDRKRYLPSDLPNDAVITMNVDASRNDDGSLKHTGPEVFKSILTEDHAFQMLAEKLAPAIHRSFLPLADRDNPNCCPYDELSGEAKADNIAAARRIPWLLGLAGMCITDTRVPGVLDSYQVVALLSEPATLEILAEEEHDLWMAGKRHNGWTLGPRDNVKRQHDLLIPYKDLEEHQKDKDRKNILGIPERVEMAGFHIVICS